MGTWKVLGQGVRRTGQRDAVKKQLVDGMIFLRSLTKGEGE